ncbi:MAG: hypothetical protein M3362_08365 [Acidobacteriota bacterium]|nr:hypothetical protein [Acidobacteriota bacterium]
MKKENLNENASATPKLARKANALALAVALAIFFAFPMNAFCARGQSIWIHSEAPTSGDCTQTQNGVGAGNLLAELFSALLQQLSGILPNMPTGGLAGKPGMPTHFGDTPISVCGGSTTTDMPTGGVGGAPGG